jgi:hypothetical protein
MQSPLQFVFASAVAVDLKKGNEQLLLKDNAMGTTPAPASVKKLSCHLTILKHSGNSQRE